MVRGAARRLSYLSHAPRYLPLYFPFISPPFGIVMCIVPAALINLMAIVMPWVELLCGLALILGIWAEAARTLIGAMLLVFITAISINLARGNAIDCGCFDPSPRPKSRAERLDDMRFVIYRDLGMLLMVAQLAYASRSRGTENG